MRPKVIVRSSFLGWLRGVWVNAFAPERKPIVNRRPREHCPDCDRWIAVTKAGKLWKHKHIGG